MLEECVWICAVRTKIHESNIYKLQSLFSLEPSPKTTTLSRPLSLILQFSENRIIGWNMKSKNFFETTNIEHSVMTCHWHSHEWICSVVKKRFNNLSAIQGYMFPIHSPFLQKT